MGGLGVDFAVVLNLFQKSSPAEIETDGQVLANMLGCANAGVDPVFSLLLLQM